MLEKYAPSEPAENGSTTTARGPHRVESPDDLECLRRQFGRFFSETRKPEAFLGLCKKRPSPDLDFHILRLIDFTEKEKKSRPKLHCSICQTEEKFYDGAMSVWSDGHARLMGRDCIVKLSTDDAFQRHAAGRFAEYAAWHARRSQIDQLTAVQPYLEQAIRQIESFAKSSATKAATKAMQAMRSETEDLHRQLFNAAKKNNGALNIETEQSGQFRQGGGKAHRHDKYQTTTVAWLQGHQALIWRYRLEQPASDAARILRIVRDKITDTEVSSLDGDTLKQAVDLVSRGIAEMEKLFGRCQEIFRFWSYENRKAICDWANHPDNGQLSARYRVTQNGIAIEGAHGKSPSLPYRFSSVPGLDALWDMRDAFRATNVADDDGGGEG